jgi:peptidoglycan/LPS O-acetylase OafA/YrhL
MTQVRDRIYSLDWLRAWAIMLVLALHASQTFNETPKSLSWLVSSGWSGVDLFFVLSGFLIGGQAFRAQNRNTAMFTELKIFWTKRWLRTVPLYFAVLFLYLFIKPMVGQEFKGWNFGFLFFLQNYTGIQDMDHTWSLCIEEQFYFVFPLLLFFTPLGRFRKLWGAPLILSVIFRYIEWQKFSFGDMSIVEQAVNIHFPTHTHMDGIAVGLFLAATSKRWMKFGESRKIGLTLLGFLIAVPTMLYTGHGLHGLGVLTTFPLLSIGFGLILVGTYGWGSDTILFRFIQKIALWSYGLYLWNTPVLGFLKRLNGQFHWSLNWLIFFIVTMVLSGITYYTIEETFLKLRNLLLKKIVKK